MRSVRSVPACLLLAAGVALASCGAPAGSATPSTAPGSSAPTAGESGGSAASIEPSASASASATDSAAPTATPDAGGTTYTVVVGDTLSSISRSFGTSVRQLQDWNAARYPSLAHDPGTIQVGWVLVVAGEAGATPQPIPSHAATPPPTPRPATGSGCTAGNRVATGSPQTLAKIPNAGSGVALTFDMGGRMDPAVDILTFLVDNRVCATIFATGAMSQTSQGKEAIAIIRAHPELFEIANHTMHHCDLARGGGGSPTTAPCQTGGSPSADFIRSQLTDAEAILSAGTGQSPQPYWRPPYGSVNQVVIDAAASVGYTKTFMWDIDTIDWKPIADGGPSAEQIASKVIGGASGGSNVLFHLGGYETLAALRLIVPALRDRGLTPTSLSDLLN